MFSKKYERYSARIIKEKPERNENIQSPNAAKRCYVTIGHIAEP